jgi:transcriptional regulator with XRE-family HTH domain
MAKSVTPIDKIVGQNIRIFRTAKGMTQTELGNGLGVTFQQIQKYENGVNRVGSGRLLQIANLLGVPIDRFFEGRAKSKNGVGPVVTDLLARPYAVRMLQAFSRVSNPDLQRSFVNLLEGVADKLER